jgi:hypothetical protein
LELRARTVELVRAPMIRKWPIALNRKPFPLPADLVNLAEIVDPNLNDDDDEFAIEGGPNGAELLGRRSRADHDPLCPRRRRYRRSVALVRRRSPKPSPSASPGRSPIGWRPTRAARIAPKTATRRRSARRSKPTRAPSRSGAIRGAIGLELATAAAATIGIIR